MLLRLDPLEWPLPSRIGAGLLVVVCISVSGVAMLNPLLFPLPVMPQQAAQLVAPTLLMVLGAFFTAGLPLGGTCLLSGFKVRTRIINSAAAAVLMLCGSMTMIALYLILVTSTKKSLTLSQYLIAALPLLPSVLLTLLFAGTAATLWNRAPAQRPGSLRSIILTSAPLYVVMTVLLCPWVIYVTTLERRFDDAAPVFWINALIERFDRRYGDDLRALERRHAEARGKAFQTLRQSSRRQQQGQLTVETVLIDSRTFDCEAPAALKNLRRKAADAFRTVLDAELEHFGTNTRVSADVRGQIYLGFLLGNTYRAEGMFDALCEQGVIDTLTITWRDRSHPESVVTASGQSPAYFAPMEYNHETQ